MKACCRSRISCDRQWRARGARERNECVSGKWRPLISLKRDALKHTHMNAVRDKALNGGPSELPVASPAPRVAFQPLGQNNIAPD